MPVMDASGVVRRGFELWASWVSSLLPVGSTPGVTPSELGWMDWCSFSGSEFALRRLISYPWGGGGISNFFPDFSRTFLEFFLFPLHFDCMLCHTDLV